MNVTQVIMLVYANWFWIAGVSSEHFQQSSNFRPVVFLLSRIPSDSFQGVSIFFGGVSTLGAVSWSSGFIFYFEDLFAFIQGSIKLLSLAAKEELLDYINTHSEDSLIDLLTYHSKIQPSGSISACLKDITYTYLFTESEAQQARSVIRLDRPLTDIWNEKRVTERVESMANLLKDLQSADDEGEEELNINTFH